MGLQLGGCHLCFQTVLAFNPEGQSKLLSLKKQGESLAESGKPEVQQLLQDTEQQWKTVMQAARQTEHRALSEDFHAQAETSQSWIRDKQLRLESAGRHAPPEERCGAAQVSSELALR